MQRETMHHWLNRYNSSTWAAVLLAECADFSRLLVSSPFPGPPHVFQTTTLLGPQALICPVSEPLD